MVFTQAPARTTSNAPLLTTATNSPPLTNRNLTPSTVSEVGSEDTGASTVVVQVGCSKFLWQRSITLKLLLCVNRLLVVAAAQVYRR